MSNSARIDELRIKFEDNNRRYFAPLANEYRKAGQLEQAIALCREHLPQQPGHMSGYIVFGQALYEAGELLEAESVFTQALELDPENLIALRHLGDIARDTNDTATAQRWYGRALDADPRNDDIAAQLASLVSARAATPKATPVVPESADRSGTPSFGMPFIDHGVIPTPDAAMRSIDPDAVTKRAATFEPLDLDDIEGGALPRTTPADNAGLKDQSDVDVPDVLSAGGQTVEQIADYVRGESRDMEGYSAEDVDQILKEADVSISGLTDTTMAFKVDQESLSVSSAGDSNADGEIDGETVDDDEKNDPFTYPIERESAAAPTLEDALTGIWDDDADDVDSETDTEAPFEAGLVAPQWPDTSDLVMRVVNPRPPTPNSVTPISLTPVSSQAYDDAAAAFGREASDPADLPDDSEAMSVSAGSEFDDDEMFDMPSVTSSGATESQADTSDDRELSYLVSAEELVDEDDADERAVLEATHDDARVTATDVDDIVEYEAAEEITAEVAAVVEDEAVDDVTAEVEAVEDVSSDVAGDDAIESETAVEQEGAAAVEAETDADIIAELSAALASDAAAAGGDSTVHVAERDSRPAGYTDTEVIDQPVDVGLDADSTNDDVEPVVAVNSLSATPAAGTAAFVTETMAELLVSQGFISRAIEVYQELVRRRPYDPVLTSRLQQLTESVAEGQRVEDEPVAQQTGASNAAIDASIEDAFAESIIEERLTPIVNTALPTPSYGTPAFATPYSQPSFVDVQDARPSAREVFAALASRRVPRRTPPQSAPVIREPTEGLSALFGTDASETEDAAARALADAFAPLSDDDVDSGSTLDLDFSRSTPAYSHLVTPSESHQQISPTPAPSFGSTPASGSSANSEFSFDRFFPDPATRAGTPASSAPATPEAPVTDDLAQFSQWLKGLGNS